MFEGVPEGRVAKQHEVQELRHLRRYEIPIDQIPKCFHVFRAGIAVIHIISVFPDIAG